MNREIPQDGNSLERKVNADWLQAFADKVGDISTEAWLNQDSRTNPLDPLQVSTLGKLLVVSSQIKDDLGLHGDVDQKKYYVASNPEGDTLGVTLPNNTELSKNSIYGLWLETSDKKTASLTFESKFVRGRKLMKIVGNVRISDGYPSIIKNYLPYSIGDEDLNMVIDEMEAQHQVGRFFRHEQTLVFPSIWNI